VIILLDRGADTASAAYGAQFVDRLVELTVAELHRYRRPIAPHARDVLTVISGLAALLAQLTAPSAARGATRARRR
jgi:hypothetical protein